MRTKQNKLSVLLLVLFLTSCSRHKNLSPEEYLHYLNSEESGFCKTKIVNKIKFSCRLQTAEWMALNASESKAKDLTEFDFRVKSFNKQLNVVLLIEDETKADYTVKKMVYSQEHYSEILSYAGTELQRDIKLQLANGKTLPCSFVHVESANSIYPAIRILASFENIHSDIRDYSLVFEDKIFNKGKLKFHYGKELFAALPTLKFKT